MHFVQKIIKQLNDFKGYLDSIDPEQPEHYQIPITDALLAYNNNLALGSLILTNSLIP